MNLMEKARRLVQSVPVKGHLAAGALLLTPLAAALPAAGNATFLTPTNDVEPTPPNNGNGFSGSNNTSSQLFNNGTELSIYGTGSASISSGSEFTVEFIWEGNWAVAPAVGDLIGVSCNATANFNNGPAPTSTSWKLQVELADNGTPEFTDSGSLSGANSASLTISSSGNAQATVASASKYKFDLTLSETLPSTDGGIYGVNLNIPSNSFELATPEPSCFLMLGCLAFPTLARRRRR